MKKVFLIALGLGLSFNVFSQSSEPKSLFDLTPEEVVKKSMAMQEMQLSLSVDMLAKQFDKLMDDGLVKKQAEMLRMFYTELVKAGFSEDQALQIILSNNKQFTPSLKIGK